MHGVSRIRWPILDVTASIPHCKHVLDRADISHLHADHDACVALTRFSALPSRPLPHATTTPVGTRDAEKTAAEHQESGQPGNRGGNRSAGRTHHCGITESHRD